MTKTFIGEPLEPVGDFDATRMSRGEPGLPEKFRRGQTVLEIRDLLEQWKGYGDCKHGSGERYVRKHFFRARTAAGEIVTVYFQRTFGKATPKTKSRWWLYTIEK